MLGADDCIERSFCSVSISRFLDSWEYSPKKTDNLFIFNLYGRELFFCFLKIRIRNLFKPLTEKVTKYQRQFLKSSVFGYSISLWKLIFLCFSFRFCYFFRPIKPKSNQTTTKLFQGYNQGS